MRRRTRTQRGTLRSLFAVANYRRYFAGQSVSVAGNWMQNVALGWYVYGETHNGTLLGMVTAAKFVPVLLFGMWGGVLSDRMDKRKILVATNLGVGVLSGVFSAMLALHVASVASATILALLLGLMVALQQPAQQAFVAEMVPTPLVHNAVALNSTMVNVARIVGPTIAGVILAVLNPAWCFGINAASTLAVVISLLRLDTSALTRSRPVERRRGQLVEGVRYAMRSESLRDPLIATAVAGTLAWEFQVTLPMMAADAFGQGASSYGGLLSALGIGAVIGGLQISSRSGFSDRTLAWGAAGWGAAIVLASLAPELITGLLLMSLVGYGSIAFNSASKTIIQLSSDEQFRGRMVGIWVLAWQGSTVIGGPLVGWVGQQFGARWALAIGGVSMLAVGWWLLVGVRKRSHAAGLVSPEASTT